VPETKSAWSDDRLPYTVLSHTADTGIEATATTYSGLLAELASGMFGLMGEVPFGPAAKVIEVDVEATGYEDLAVDTLSELLYRSEVEDLFLFGFDVDAPSDFRIHVSANGVPNTEVEPTGPPIKAVTYHDIAVQQTSHGWYGRVYFDV
jgi:SHS2 domain-containing protein